MIERKTVFSPDRQYRYVLWREWPCDPPNRSYAMFIGLNPSTADETQDDPTIRRCMAFAKSWGYGALCMANLFAFRATDPAVMLGATAPIGIDNDKWLLECARHAGVIVAAWGVHGNHLGRAAQVLGTSIGLWSSYLRQGVKQPCHPLYLPGNLAPVVFWPPFNEWLRRITVTGIEHHLHISEINVVPVADWRRRFDAGMDPESAWREELGSDEVGSHRRGDRSSRRDDPAIETP